jgi:hypothetical protein
MLLLCSHASRLEADLEESKTEKRELRKKAENWMQSYYGEKERSAVLGVALRKDSSKGKTQSIVAAIGGIVAEAGIPLLVTGPIGFGLAGVILGFTLLVVGFWPSQSNDKIGNVNPPSI